MLLPNQAFRKLLEIIRDDVEFDAPSRDWCCQRLKSLDESERSKAAWKSLWDAAAGQALRDASDGQLTCN